MNMNMREAPGEVKKQLGEFSPEFHMDVLTDRTQPTLMHICGELILDAVVDVHEVGHGIVRSRVVEKLLQMKQIIEAEIERLEV